MKRGTQGLLHTVAEDFHNHTATTLNLFFFSFQFTSVRLTFSRTRANPSLVARLLSQFGGDDSLQEELREDAATQASASRLAPRGGGR